MPMKTQAYVLEKVRAPFKLQDIELHDPIEGEVIVEIKATGICHTDISIQNGALPSVFPSIAGHEGSGKVVKVGKGVTRVKEGDSVLLSFSYCQKCKTCKRGHPASCRDWTALNFGRLRPDKTNVVAASEGTDIHGTFFGQSSFARHALVVESSVVKVPDDTDLVALCPLGCGMQTGSGAVLNLFKPEYPAESSIVIFGAGAVGMSAVFASAAIGMKNVILVDLLQHRLEDALQFGATHIINGRDADILQKIIEITDGGADYSVDATGAPPCVKTAWACLGPMGKMCQLGSPGPGPAITIPIHDAVTNSRTYHGCCEGMSNPPVYIPQLIDLYKQGKFPLDKLSKVYNYKDFGKAIEAMEHGEVVKPIVVFED